MPKLKTNTPEPTLLTSEQAQAWLDAYASTGSTTKACQAAGVTPAAVRAHARRDATFKAARADAREAHSDLVYEALLAEALGVEHVDSVNGKRSIVRNVDVLKRLAVKLGHLDHDKVAPTVAIQNNATVQPTSQLARGADEGMARLRALMRKPDQPVITVEATLVDDGADLT